MVSLVKYEEMSGNALLKYVLLGDLNGQLKLSELKTDGLTWHAHTLASHCADHCLVQKYTFSIWVRHIEL